MGLKELSDFLDSTTNELVALIITSGAVLVSVYLSIKTGQLVFLGEAGLVVIGYFFVKKAGGAQP